MPHDKAQLPPEGSLALEYALAELFGHDSQWYGSAGMFTDSASVRKAMLAATRKIRSRIGEVVVGDERLQVTTTSTLHSLESAIRDISGDDAGSVDVYGELLALIAYLLGYDWQTGKPNRQIVYFQTADQEWKDDVSRHPDATGSTEHTAELQKRNEIVCLLHDQGCRPAKIARIMRISNAMVVSILVRAGRISRSSSSRHHTDDEEAISGPTAG